jgi:hypothetical protein
MEPESIAHFELQMPRDCRPPTGPRAYEKPSVWTGDETELWRNAANKNFSDAAENQTTGQRAGPFTNIFFDQTAAAELIFVRFARNDNLAANSFEILLTL